MNKCEQKFIVHHTILLMSYHYFFFILVKMSAIQFHRTANGFTGYDKVSQHIHIKNAQLNRSRYFKLNRHYLVP